MSESTEIDHIARSLADESFRHSWDSSDERLIGGAWVSGLCCECGEFVPFGQEVDHITEAFAPVIRRAQAERLTAWNVLHRRAAELRTAMSTSPAPTGGGSDA